MSPEQMERAIEFLLSHYSRLGVITEQHSDQIARLSAVSERHSEQIAQLAANLDAIIREMRDGFNRLIESDELTHSLIEKLTVLGIQTSRRITRLEQA